jgi:GT2 family glycosyltransferase
MENLDVSIIIVTYKTRDLTRRLLESIFRETKSVSFEVIVVDNNSADGSVEMIAKEFPGVELLSNRENLGFAKANNQAITVAKGRHFLLLNPDTELFADAAATLVKFADSHPNAAVVGPKILNPDKTIQPSVLSFPTFCSSALIMLKAHHFLCRLPCLQRYFLPDFNYEKSQTVDQVRGAAFLITKTARDQIGKFDERFFIWFEEVDFCKRAKDRGLEVWYLAETSLIHHGAQSFNQLMTVTKQRLYNASLAKYMAKHRGIAAALGVKVLNIPSLSFAWVTGLLKIRRKKYA